MLTANNSDARWFDTLPAWPYVGGTPAQHLADNLRAAGKVVEPVGESLPAPGDEWKWLGPEGDGTAAAIPVVAEDDEPGATPDDALAVPVVTDEASGARRARRRRRGLLPARGLVAAGVAAVVVVAGAAVVVGVLVGGGGQDPAPRDPVEVLADSEATGAVAGADDCPESVDGAVTVGNDAGDQNSGPGVIKAFDYAYYVERSAQRARAVATPTGVGSAEALQASIDALPADTAHCLRITDRGNGLYAVQLTETRPGEPPIVYPQLIQTVVADGKSWIASIKKDAP